MESIVETTTTITITLILSEKQARWLKGVVQNPLQLTPDEEPIEEKEMRETFWKALEVVK